MSSLEIIYSSEKSLSCVYVTLYYGLKMPPLYIGSTTVAKIESGYRGTVTSKKWKDIWKQELKEHPELFNTIILSVHDTREEAFDQELIMQKLFNVVKSPLFINLAYAKGKFGLDISGEKNPFYGKRHTEEYRKCQSIAYSGVNHPKWGKKDSEETRKKKSIKAKESNARHWKGKKFTEEHRQNMSEARKNVQKFTCGVCGKILAKCTFILHNHGPNCKQVPIS